MAFRMESTTLGVMVVWLFILSVLTSLVTRQRDEQLGILRRELARKTRTYETLMEAHTETGNALQESISQVRAFRHEVIKDTHNAATSATSQPTSAPALLPPVTDFSQSDFQIQLQSQHRAIEHTIDEINSEINSLKASLARVEQLGLEQYEEAKFDYVKKMWGKWFDEKSGEPKEAPKFTTNATKHKNSVLGAALYKLKGSL